MLPARDAQHIRELSVTCFGDLVFNTVDTFDRAFSWRLRLSEGRWTGR